MWLRRLMQCAVMRLNRKRWHRQSKQKRSQGRDTDLGMIINNALRNKNQKKVWQQWKGQPGLWAVCVARERTSLSCLFWCYLRQQVLINSGLIWLSLPVGKERKEEENQPKSCELQLTKVQRTEKKSGKKICRSQLVEFYYKVNTPVTGPRSGISHNPIHWVCGEGMGRCKFTTPEEQHYVYAVHPLLTLWSHSSSS